MIRHYDYYFAPPFRYHTAWAIAFGYIKWLLIRLTFAQSSRRWDTTFSALCFAARGPCRVGSTRLLRQMHALDKTASTSSIIAHMGCCDQSLSSLRRCNPSYNWPGMFLAGPPQGGLAEMGWLLKPTRCPVTACMRVCVYIHIYELHNASITPSAPLNLGCASAQSTQVPPYLVSSLDEYCYLTPVCLDCR